MATALLQNSSNLAETAGEMNMYFDVLYIFVCFMIHTFLLAFSLFSPNVHVTVKWIIMYLNDVICIHEIFLCI